MKRCLFLSLLLLAACATPDAAPPPRPGDPFVMEIAAFAAADAVERPAACQTLFVGSSSVRLWTTLAADMAPRGVINRGFGGSTIADVNRYFDETVSRYRPRAIVFYAGENDVNFGEAPAAVVAALRDFMALKRRALGTTPVYYISVKPSRARWAQYPAQSEVNAAIARIAARERDLVFIDVVAPMLNDGAPMDIYLADGLHMGAAGYAIWTRVVSAALDQPAPTRAPHCP
jgi:lysophospholipase L1-like esterase